MNPQIIKEKEGASLMKKLFKVLIRTNDDVTSSEVNNNYFLTSYKKKESFKININILKCYFYVN